MPLNERESETVFVSYSFQKQREENKFRYLKKCFNIIITYFWIHSIGLTKQYKSPFKSYIAIILSFFLAVFFEGNTVYMLLLRCKKVYSLELQLKTIFAHTAFTVLGILQRYYLFCSRKKAYVIFRRCKILNTQFSTMQENNLLKFKILIFFIFIDCLSLAMVILVYYTYLPILIFNSNEELPKNMRVSYINSR